VSRELVLVHGRAQERKDSIALKAEWLDALGEGLAKSGLTLPIPESSVRFPFYGDTLYEMVDGLSADAAAEVVVRGAAQNADQKQFTLAVMREIQERAGISDEQVAAAIGEDVVQRRGPQNWEWVQGILRAVDRYVPHGSGTSIALFTNDVYQYLRNPGIRAHIENGVSKALTQGVETIVVSHSLGTVVAYNLLQREGEARGWRVPLFVTLGSPLAIGEIRKSLRAMAPPRCPPCAGGWFNAMDERDVVALYPLTPDRFPLAPDQPAIVNKTDVRNRTRNRHGIGGYLDDQEVARRIHDALVA
jgi:hypothetical protein